MLLEVYERQGRLMACGSQWHDWVDELKGEWCGPQVPVEEVEKAWREALSVSCRMFYKNDWKNSRARRVVEGESMKTAEYWAERWTDIYYALKEKGSTEFQIEQAQDNLTRQIQLDAMKEGMRRAANGVCNAVIVTSVFEETITAVKYTQQAIHSAAEQLTEKDL